MARSPKTPSAPPGEPAARRGTGAGGSPHDALFRALLSDPARAGAFLRNHLPNDIAGHLADTLPVILDGSFVDEALADHIDPRQIR